MAVEDFPLTSRMIMRSVITQHALPPFRCRNCRPDGTCEQLDWARQIKATAGLSHPHT